MRNRSRKITCNILCAHVYYTIWNSLFKIQCTNLNKHSKRHRRAMVQRRRARRHSADRPQQGRSHRPSRTMLRLLCRTVRCLKHQVKSESQPALDWLCRITNSDAGYTSVVWGNTMAALVNRLPNPTKSRSCCRATIATRQSYLTWKPWEF